MSQATTLKAQFREEFDATAVTDLSLPDSHDPEDLLQSADETMLYCPRDCPWVGIMEFHNYEDNDGWTLTYTKENMQSVYVFDVSDFSGRVCIDADKIEVVADLLSKTPATVADSVQTYRGYPVAIPAEDVQIVIAPMANVQTED